VQKKIRDFSFGSCRDIIHKETADFVDNTQHNGAGKSKRNVDDTSTEAFEQCPLGSLAVINANVVVAAASTWRHCKRCHHMLQIYHRQLPTNISQTHEVLVFISWFNTVPLILLSRNFRTALHLWVIFSVGLDSDHSPQDKMYFILRISWRDQWWRTKKVKDGVAVRHCKNQETELHWLYTTSTEERPAGPVMSWTGCWRVVNSQGRLLKTSGEQHWESTLKRWNLPGEEPGGLIVTTYDGGNSLTSVPAGMGRN